MADVWLGRYSRWLEKLVNAKGGPLIFDVAPSIQTVISTQSGVEELYLQSVYRYGGFQAAAAVAGDEGVIQLRNPSGSGVVSTTELIGIQMNPAVSTFSTFHLSVQNGIGDLSTPARGLSLDFRNKASSASVISSSQGPPNNDLANVIFFNSGNNANGLINATLGLPLVLLPGDVLRVVDKTLNEAYTVEFVWRERALESSELT